MFAWLDDSGMRRDVGCGYGLMHDNPNSVPKEECRYDACVELLEGFESTVPVGFRFMRLPGGAYARQRIKGIGGLSDAIHLDDPAKVAEDLRRIDICVPVGVAASSHRAA
jgi:DNA gyrase inhibitor GyrI